MSFIKKTDPIDYRGETIIRLKRGYEYMGVFFRTQDQAKDHIDASLKKKAKEREKRRIAKKKPQEPYIFVNKFYDIK